MVTAGALLCLASPRASGRADATGCRGPGHPGLLALPSGGIDVFRWWASWWPRHAVTGGRMGARSGGLRGDGTRRWSGGCCGTRQWSVRDGSAVPWGHGWPRPMCDCAPWALWWCPWRRSCDGADRFSLLSDEDAGESPSPLTLSGDDVGGAGRHPLLEGDIGDFGRLSWPCRELSMASCCRHHGASVLVAL
jgi:hypothetical protein